MLPTETDTLLLGNPLASKVDIRLTAHEGVATTDTYQPLSMEFNTNNPEPVKGYAAQFKLDLETAKIGQPKTKCVTDGRYLYQTEAIIGQDDRQQVTATNAWPYTVHGHMVMRFPNGQVYMGTGTIVNRHHVLTAGHCVFSKADGGWATSIDFYPGQNDAQKPFGKCSATRLLSVKGWTESTDENYDFAMFTVDREIGEQTGWFGIATFGNDNDLHHKRVNVSGYPGDKGGQQMWTHADVIKTVSGERVGYDIDTMGGQSGSGVWSQFAGMEGEKVAAIHTTGSATGNGATRISRWKFDKLVEWMQSYSMSMQSSAVAAEKRESELALAAR